MGHDIVRMGGAKGLGPAKMAALISFVVFAAVVGVVTMSVMSSPSDGKTEKKGCSSDSECEPGRMCAAGGCIVLLSSENAGMWRDDIAAQRDPSVGWKPIVPFGEKMIPTVACSLRRGEVRAVDEKHVMPQVRISVFEIGSTSMVLHQMAKAKGDMWIESLRFRLPGGVRPGEDTMCASSGVDRFQLVGDTGAGAETVVDVSLKQAVPVGGVAAAAISVTGDPPPADEAGVRSLDLTLHPLGPRESAGRTVLALPLGSSVISMEGPRPSRQRLLEGYFAYYWDHEVESAEVTVRFELAEHATGRLDMTVLNP